MVCHVSSLLNRRNNNPNRSSVKSSSRIVKPVTAASVVCSRLTRSFTVTLRWSPSLRIWASQIVVIHPQLSSCCDNP